MRKRDIALKSGFLKMFFLQHAGSAYFFNPRFLFTQKGKKKPGKVTSLTF